MHDKSLAQLRHQLTALSTVLKKAEAHCEARKIDPQAILGFRLYPDMLAFMRQIRLAYPARRRIYWIQDNLSANWVPSILAFASASCAIFVQTNGLARSFQLAQATIGTEH